MESLFFLPPKSKDANNLVSLSNLTWCCAWALKAILSSSPPPAVSLLSKPHTKACWITGRRSNWSSGLLSAPWFSVSFLSAVLPPPPPSVYLLCPADANAGLAKRGSGLTPVLWANITPQQVWRSRGSKRESRVWTASSPVSGLQGRKSIGFIYCLSDSWMLRYLTPPLAP